MQYKNWILGAVLAGLTVPAQAQRVTTGGVVDRVDPTAGSITIRKANNARQEISVSPDANLTIGGRKGLLGEIMFNANVSMLAWRDRTGRLHADTVRVTQPTAPTRSAAAVPGTIVQGQIAGVNAQGGTVVLKTSTGFRNVDLGLAPIMRNGRDVPLSRLRPGDYIQVQHVLPEGAQAPVPSLALVLPPQRVAGSRQTLRGQGAGSAPGSLYGGTTSGSPRGGLHGQTNGYAQPNGRTQGGSSSYGR